MCRSVTVAKAGAFSPVLTSGGFPIIDGIITAFDSLSGVTLAYYGLSILEATGLSRLLRRVYFPARKYIDGLETTKAKAVGISAASPLMAAHVAK